MGGRENEGKNLPGDVGCAGTVFYKQNRMSFAERYLAQSTVLLSWQFVVG